MKTRQTVLITGAGGFIGQYLVRAWRAKGAQVVAAGRSLRGSRSDSYTEIPGNIDAKKLSHASQPDYIFHGAGPGSIPLFAQNPVRSQEDEITTLDAVLSYASHYSPKSRIVFLSTGSVYGEASVQPTPESSPLNPLSPYAQSKVAAEKLCRDYAGRGLKISIVRLFSVYGPGLRKQLLWDACHKIQSGKLEFSGTGEESRDWLHIEDAVTLLAMAAQRADAHCPIVNGGTGYAVSVREVLSHLCQIQGVPPKIRFSGTHSPEQPKHLIADTSLSRTWGFQPAKNWQTGFADYVHWFQEVTGAVPLTA